MKIKLIFSILLFTFFAACENMDVRKYAESYNSDLEYGDIEKINKNLDYKIETNREEKLKIGLFVPLSGPAKFLGESLLNSAELSLFKNQKNNIILMVYDTKGTTFGAVEAMNQAIKDGVNAIIGPVLYSEAKAISDLAKKNNIVLFALSNEQKLMNNDNIFVSASIPEQEIELLISTLMKNSITNFIAYLPNNQYGAYINDILKIKLKEKNANLIKVEFYNKDEKAFDKKLLDLVNSYKISPEFLEQYELNKKIGLVPIENQLNLKEEDKIKPQILFLGESGKFAEAIGLSLYKNKNNIKNNNLQLVGISNFEGDPNILKNPYLDGIIFVGSNIEKYTQFEKDYIEKYNNNPTKLSSIVYDLVNTLDQFYIKEEGVYLINKEKLLYPLGYDGVDGKFRFIPNGLIERNMYILQVQNKQKILINTNQEFLNY